MILTHRSGFTLSDGDGQEIVHVLPCRLWIPGGAYGDVQTVRRSVALDHQTIQVETFAGGAEEIRARIRFHGDPSALRDLLREGARGRVLTYFPDLAVPAESYPTVVMDYGEVVALAPDGARFAYGEYEAPVTLRRIDGGSLAPLATGVLFQYHAGSPLTGLTFTRSTPGVRISAARQLETIAAGLRRITWIERNGVLRPYTLLEAARTNVLLRSEEFDHAVWNKARLTVTANQHTAPDGTTTADRLVEDTQTGQHHVNQNVVATANVTYALSVFVKDVGGGRNWVFLQIGDAATSVDRVTAYFNVATGVVGQTGANGNGVLARAIVEALGNRWYRVTLVGSVGGGATSIKSAVMLAAGDGVSSYTGDGASYLAVWGTQFEDAAPFPSSYVQTVGAIAARAAEQLVAPYPFGPMDATWYGRWIEHGTRLHVAFAQVAVIGSGTDPRWIPSRNNGAGSYQTVWRPTNDTGDQVTVTVGGQAAIGDLVEQRAEIWEEDAQVGIQLHQSINGAPESSSVVGTSPLPFPAAFGQLEYRVNGSGAGAAGFAPHQVHLIVRGRGHTLHRLREIAGVGA